MDAHRFDALTHFIGSRTSRRGAVGLAATGLLSFAVPDAAAARCSKQKPGPVGKKCKRHRCKPDVTQNGASCGADKTCGGETFARSAPLPGGAKMAGAWNRLMGSAGEGVADLTVRSVRLLLR